MPVSSMWIPAAVAAAALCGAAQAATFVPQNSTMTVRVGGAEPVQITAQTGTEGSVSLGGGGATLTVGANVFQTTGKPVPTSLFSFLPGVTGVQMNAANQAGNLSTGFSTDFRVNAAGPECTSCFGGVMGLSGSMVLGIGGFLTKRLPFTDIVGVGGTAHLSVLGTTVTMIGDPFVTGPIAITGVSTPKVQLSTGAKGAVISLEPTINQTYTTLTTGGGEPVTMQTVTVRGSNSLSQLGLGQSAAVTLVAPMRVDAPLDYGGSIPAVVKTKFVFTPEPEVNLLVGAAVGVLAFLGHRRMRRGSP